MPPGVPKEPLPMTRGPYMRVAVEASLATLYTFRKLVLASPVKELDARNYEAHSNVITPFLPQRFTWFH